MLRLTRKTGFARQTNQFEISSRLKFLQEMSRWNENKHEARTILFIFICLKVSVLFLFFLQLRLKFFIVFLFQTIYFINKRIFPYLFTFCSMLTTLITDYDGNLTY